MDNNNESQKEQESNPMQINNVDRRYSVKINSSKEISDKLHANFIQRQSPIQSLPMFNLNFQKDEKNSLNNPNSYKIIPTYSPLTPQLIPKDPKFLNRKFFPSKEDVCRGNPDINQKKSIPSSSPLTQYFNIDIGFNKDMGFSLDNQNSNNFPDTPSQVSNGQSDMFNCSPSIFFNKGTINELGKNLEELNITGQESEEFKNKIAKEEENELYSVKVNNEHKDSNLKESNNIILNKINEIKHKKMKVKNKSNNNMKQKKNALNNKDKDKNKSKTINNKNNVLENENNNKVEKVEKIEINKTNDIKPINLIPEKLLDNNNNSQMNVKLSNPNIKEENSPIVDLSPEISKKIEEYLDKYDESPIMPKKEINNKDFNDINNKELWNNNINKISNDKPNTNINIGNNNNPNQIKFNMNNFPDNNMIGNNNTQNLNYISGMNINCTNLNINNYSGLNQIDQGNNFQSKNQNPSYYYPNKNNNNNMPFMQDYQQNNNFNNNNNNYQNNMYNNNNYQGNNFMDQYNGMNNNNNYYNIPNNMEQGYSFSSNNDNNINNYVFSMRNIDSSNKKDYSKKGSNNYPQNDKRKKIKKLENSMYMNKPLSFLAQNIIVLGKDQSACRYIQKLISENPTETLRIFYGPICDNILQLINDQFGNYLIQKILTYLNEDQLINILKLISFQFFEICCNNHGTRVLQKFMDYSKTPKVVNSFYHLLKPLIAPLLKELKGTFIVQKFAKVYPDYQDEINEIIIQNSPDLSTHRHGCCVIQNYLELKDPVMTPRLLDKLIEKCLLLIVDQFGNYVIQTILLMGIKKYGNKLAENIAQNIVYYAKHKYSSNVVEKCFDYCDGIYLYNLMMNVQRKENLRELILDEHGNYVVQKVLLLSDSKTKVAMLKLIVPLFDQLKARSYGERVINKLYATYPMIADRNFMNDI